jgi:nucleotide-binding universal stress UspA family protein
MGARCSTVKNKKVEPSGGGYRGERDGLLRNAARAEGRRSCGRRCQSRDPLGCDEQPRHACPAGHRRSEEALAATDWLLTFPLPRSSTVRVFAVASLAGTLTPELESAREYRRRLSKRTSLIVSAARDMLDRRWVGAEGQMADGDPREEIVRVAGDWPADLVVLGARVSGAAPS